MTVGELKKYLDNVTDDFKINFVCNITDKNDHFMNLCNMTDISIDIGYGEKTIDIFGRLSVVLWHDLRKEPGDLPKESEMVQDENGERFYYFRGHFYYFNDSIRDHKPIAWCEIPEFEED